jgi:hypothetical protein
VTPSELTKAIDALVGCNISTMEPSIETALAYEHAIDVLGERVVDLIWGRHTRLTMEEVIVTFLEPEPTCEEE